MCMCARAFVDMCARPQHVCVVGERETRENACVTHTHVYVCYAYACVHTHAYEYVFFLPFNPQPTHTHILRARTHRFVVIKIHFCFFDHGAAALKEMVSVTVVNQKWIWDPFPGERNSQIV